MFYNSADKAGLVVGTDRTLQSLVDHLHESKNGLASRFVGKTYVTKPVVPSGQLPELETETRTATDQRRALDELWLSRCDAEAGCNGDSPEPA